MNTKKGIVISLQPIFLSTNQKDILKKTTQNIIMIYGFSSNASLSIWEKLVNIMKNMTKLAYFHRPFLIDYYDLCQKTKPPKWIGVMSRIIDYKPDTDNNTQSYMDELVLRIRGNKVIEAMGYNWNGER